MGMPPRKKVVIVGGGIAGLTIANTLVEKAKDSVEVTVITRDSTTSVDQRDHYY